MFVRDQRVLKNGSAARVALGGPLEKSPANDPDFYFETLGNYAFT